MVEIKTSADAAAAFGILMGDAPAAPAAPADQLVEEMRGPIEESNAAPATEGSEDTAPELLDTPGDVLDKLRRARQEAGTTAYKLGKTRAELAEKDQLIARMEARLAALESGRSAPTAQADESVTQLSPSQLDALMVRFDKDWETSREDPYKLSAAQYAANMVMTLYQQMRDELGGVVGGVRSMQFNTRLERLGISRPQFDAVWQDPAYAWGAALDDDGRLAALETQAGTMGNRLPNTGATPQVSAPGARPTSRVNPRTIETSQAPGSAGNPVRLKELELRQALEKKDFASARRAAAPLFEAVMNRA